MRGVGRRETQLTDDVIPKEMLSDVIKEGGENRQQGDGGVVDVLGHTFHLLWEEKQAMTAAGAPPVVNS